MRITWRKAFCTAAAALIWTGCSTSPPGAGLTNGELPASGGTERTAERTDLPAPNLTGGPESQALPAAEGTATPPTGPGTATGSASSTAGAAARPASPGEAQAPPTSNK